MKKSIKTDAVRLKSDDNTIKPVFKICTACGEKWESRQEFLQDPEVKISGYQVHFKELTEGMFLFNHSCKATLAIHAGEFTDMYQGPIFKKRATGTKKCPGYCLKKNELRVCPVQCECAYVREVVQIVKNYKKI